VFPEIYLAVDNCFASKRWTEPSEWMRIVRDAGIFYVEASADTECDPLYSPPEVLQDWIEAVQAASARTGVRVANLYSGHGTYATLGLAHPDPRVRDHIQHRWLEPMIRNAAVLGAGLGFFCHAFPQSVLRQPERYAEAEADLIARLTQLAGAAWQAGVSLCIEQMYSPHQIPWTIDGAARMVQAVYDRSGTPFYLTLDTGHQVGQRRFLLPPRAAVEAVVAALRQGQAPPDVWLGLIDVVELIDEPGAVERLLTEMQRRAYLFAAEEDGDLYAWLRRLGCYASIIHLQQTDGLSSAHHPFTEPYNRQGIVVPERLLRALYDSYVQTEAAGFPPRCKAIYLTIELFSGTAERPEHSLANIRESAAYWRRFVPEDGLKLDELVRSVIG